MKYEQPLLKDLLSHDALGAACRNGTTASPCQDGGNGDANCYDGSEAAGGSCGNGGGAGSCSNGDFGSACGYGYGASSDCNDGGNRGSCGCSNGGGPGSTCCEYGDTAIGCGSGGQN